MNAAAGGVGGTARQCFQVQKDAASAKAAAAAAAAERGGGRELPQNDADGGAAFGPF